MNNSIAISKAPVGRDDLDDLLVKVEGIENRISTVEEELQSARRVRRHLEQAVNETRSSLTFVGNQIVPLDAMMNRVQITINSTLEDMNETLYENHLKKLYYKVDGMTHKNETNALIERLQHVESELRDSVNNSIFFKLSQDLQTTKENFHHLNSSVTDTVISLIETLNNSIKGILVPRIEVLETEAVPKDTIKELQENMTDLLNITELRLKNVMLEMHSSIINIQNNSLKAAEVRLDLDDLLARVKNVENLTKEVEEENKKERPLRRKLQRNLIERLENVEGEVRHCVNISIFSKHTEDLNMAMRNFNNMLESVSFSNRKLNNLIESILIPRIETLENESNRKVTVEELEEKMKNLFNDTELMIESHLMDLRSSVKNNQMNGQDDQSCEKPVVNDSHALIDVVKDAHGRSTLKYGCQPIGLYTATRVPVPPRCEKGSWKGPLPSCKKVLEQWEQWRLSGELLKGWSCSAGPGVYADPFNCSQYIKCLNVSPEIVPCRSGLIYNEKLKKCSEPTPNLCNSTKIENALQNLTPVIFISPYKIDAPFEPVGTGAAGELMVLPSTNFSLRCLYLEDIWEPTKWNVAYFQKNTRRNIESMSNDEGYVVMLTVTDAQEDDSGIYTCSTNFGAEHAIEVQVKEVTCPAFKVANQSEVTYHPVSADEKKIMNSRAKIWCQNGSIIFSQCMADGKWSIHIPSPDECPLSITPFAKLK